MVWQGKFKQELKNWSGGTRNWRRPEPSWRRRSGILSTGRLTWLRRRDSATPEVGTGIRAPEPSAGRKRPLQSLVSIRHRLRGHIRYFSTVSIRKIVPGSRRFGGQQSARKGI